MAPVPSPALTWWTTEPGMDEPTLARGCSSRSSPPQGEGHRPRPRAGAALRRGPRRRGGPCDPPSGRRNTFTVSHPPCASHGGWPHPGRRGATGSEHFRVAAGRRCQTTAPPTGAAAANRVCPHEADSAVRAGLRGCLLRGGGCGLVKNRNVSAAEMAASWACSRSGIRSSFSRSRPSCGYPPTIGLVGSSPPSRGSGEVTPGE